MKVNKGLAEEDKSWKTHKKNTYFIPSANARSIYLCVSEPQLLTEDFSDTAFVFTIDSIVIQTRTNLQRQR